MANMLEARKSAGPVASSDFARASIAVLRSLIVGSDPMSAGGQTRRQFAIGAAAVAVAFEPRAVRASTVYARTVLARDPIAYWRLGEQRGAAAADTTGHAHAGAYRGDIVFGQPGAIIGDSDGAAGMNGNGTYVEITDSVDFSQPTSGRGLTVEAWMRPSALTFAGDTAQKYVHWLGKGQAGVFEWGFRFYSADSPTRPNRISAYIWNAAGGEGAGAYFQDVLRPGVWIHVVATYDPGDRSDPAAGVSIYRDGAGNPRRTRGARYTSYDIAATHGSAPVRLGTRNLTSFFSGSLDEIAIYPRVLSADEIAGNYRASGR
jgi:hypothetical protein